MMKRGDNMGDFLDTNVVLYAYGDDVAKSPIANGLLAARPCISTQVINECSHVMRRKLDWSPDKITEELEVLLTVVALKPVGIEHIRLGWKIAARYGFSHYDSVIVASALQANCGYLFSEDLQHGQIIEDCLKIVNPFLAKVEL